MARLVSESGKADGSTGPRSSGSAVRAGRRVRIVMAGMIARVARVSGRPIRDELAVQPLPGVLTRPDEVRPAVADSDLGRDRMGQEERHRLGEAIGTDIEHGNQLADLWRDHDGRLAEHIEP